MICLLFILYFKLLMYIVLIVVSKLANPCEKTTSLGFPICLPTGSFMLNLLLHFLPLSCQQLYFIGDCCSIELEVRAAALPGKQYFILYITSQCIESGKLVISHFISSIIYYAEGIVLSAAVESGMWYVLYLKASLAFVSSLRWGKYTLHFRNNYVVLGHLIL